MKFTWVGKLMVVLLLLAGFTTFYLDSSMNSFVVLEPENKAPVFQQIEKEGVGTSYENRLQPVKEKIKQQQIEVIEEKFETEEKIKVVLELREGDSTQEFIDRYDLDKESVKKYESFPFIAVEIDEEDFKFIKESEELQNIQEDVLFHATLVQSVPIIGGNNVSDTWGHNGSGVTVAVLDTGVNKAHTAFQDRVVSEACYSSHNPGSNYYSLCPGQVLSTTANNSGLDCDESVSSCGHGTHVAGIIAANHTSGNGVAPGVNIIAIQVFTNFTAAGDCAPKSAPCALSYFSDILSGLNRVYALRDNYTIAAASISIGGGYYTSNCDGSFGSMKTVIDNLKAEGIATVISSGNDGYTDGMGAPACISTAISTGATTKADAVAGYSNSASFLTILAPGSSINAPVISGGYGLKSGTSMAAPHASGAFALVKQAYPNKTVDEVLYAFNVTGTNLTKSSVTKPRINVDSVIATFQEVIFSDFNGNTTDFNSVPNISNVCLPILEDTGHGRIDFDGCVDASGANLNQYVSIVNNTISVDTTVLSSWNISANLTFYDLNLQDPVIVDDETNQICDHCTLVSNIGGDVVITVNHFSSYTVVDNVSLFMIDQTDSVTKTTSEPVLFSANHSYTNTTPINDANCTISFETPSGYDHATMSYNGTSEDYEYTRSFSFGGNYDWNVSCYHSSNPTIRGTDDYTIVEYGVLRAEFESHEYETLYYINQNLTFNSGALLYCDGNGTASCGNISSNHLDNRTGSIDLTSTTPGTTPLYTLTSQPLTCTGLVTDSPCYFNWTINATGAIGERFQFGMNFTSTLAQVADTNTTIKLMEINSANNANLTQIGNTTLTAGTSGNYSQTATAVASESGNTTRVTLDGSQTTTKWQGFFGNLNNTLRLGDGNNVFYEFPTTYAFAIIATQDTSFDFSNVSAATASDVDAHWNFLTDADVDQANDTFTKQKFFGDIKDVPYATLHEKFYSGVVQDRNPSGKGDFGFIGIVNTSGAQGFRNETHNYELMVPVESGTESYYFYLALS